VSERTPLITQLGGRNDLVTKKVPLAHHGGPGPRNARIALAANATAQRYPSEMPIEYTSDTFFDHTFFEVDTFFEPRNARIASAAKARGPYNPGKPFR
jgi:hypothetical protein